MQWAVIVAQGSREFDELDGAAGGGRAVNMQAELARRGLLPKRKKKTHNNNSNKNKNKNPYKVKNLEMRIQQYPNALTFLQSWRKSVRIATISACEKSERARAFCECDHTIARYICAWLRSRS